MISLFSALVLTVGLGAAPAAAPATLSVGALSAPVDAASALCLPSSAPVQMAKTGDSDPGIGALAFCQAHCGDGTTLSCSGGSCSAQDQNCPYVQGGYVQCDGNYQYCSYQCPATCGPAQCRQGCSCPGGISVCDSLVECSCHCEWF